jgi:RNA polymerase sigma-70 factor (ECF subfamily)
MAIPDGSARPGELADHLFRHEAGRMVARLTRAFGAEHLGLAEEAVQESLLEALGRWPWEGIPREPAAWLWRVARNRALDVLRRRTRFRALEGDVVSLLVARVERLPEIVFARELDDDPLRLIFTCCHPALAPASQVALTLKTVCGFSVDEIARAFLARRATVAQRLARAKSRLAELRPGFQVPPPEALGARLRSVHRVLYLLFNEGYAPGAGDSAIRADACAEAVRLAELVASHPVTGTSESHALAALLLLQGARLATRQDAQGEILLLAEQDRSLWDQAWLARGFAHLRRAMDARELGALHLEAGIAAAHAAAPSYEATDWPAILGYYDRLMELGPSPVVALNRAVAVAHVRGPEAASAECDALANEPALASYYLLPAVRAELYRRSGRRADARRSFERALALAGCEPVRRLLQRRLAEVGGAATLAP